MTPSIWMALQDYLPVFISVFSFFLISKTVSVFNPALKWVALTGLVLCFTGGFLKATEKVIWALTTEETLWMKYSLFICNSLGFIFLASALWCALGSINKRCKSSVWLLPFSLGTIELVLISYLAIEFPGRQWFFTTLGIAFLANFTMIICLILLSRKINQPKFGYIFALSFFLVLTLVGLARSPSETINVEWVKQGVNTISALCFAIGVWLVYKNTPSSPSEKPVEITESYQNT